MFFDLVRRLIPQCPNVRYLICLDRFKQENGVQLEQILDYETLINENDEALWEDFSEETASGLCYTRRGLLGTPRAYFIAIEVLCSIRLLFVCLIVQLCQRWIQCLQLSRCFMLTLGVTLMLLLWLVLN